MSKLLFEQHTRRRLIDLSLWRLGGDSHYRSSPDLTHGLPLVLTQVWQRLGSNELLAYNINIQLQNAAIENEILTKFTADDMTSDSNYKFVRYMDLAMNPAGESALDNFAVWLLTLLGYAPRTSMTRTSVDIPLNICGEQHYAKTNVCVVDGDDILLFVQENRRHKKQKDPEPRRGNRHISGQRCQTVSSVKTFADILLSPRSCCPGTYACHTNCRTIRGVTISTLYRIC